MKIFYPTVEPARASFLCLRVNREEEEAAASARLSTAFKSFLFSLSTGMCFGDEKLFKVSVQGLDSKFVFLSLTVN